MLNGVMFTDYKTEKPIGTLSIFISHVETIMNLGPKLLPVELCSALGSSDK